MHEDLTSYDCIVIIFTAILYSHIKVKFINIKKETCFQLLLIIISTLFIILIGIIICIKTNEDRWMDAMSSSLLTVPNNHQGLFIYP